MTELIILLISLAAAIGASYAFLQWKCPTKKEKLVTITEQASQEEEIDLTELEEATPAKIKEGKKKLAEAISEAKKIQKKKADEIEEEEQTVLEALPHLEEAQALLKEVNKKEDLEKKVYGGWDYAYASGIGLAIACLSFYVIKAIWSKAKGESN